MSNIKQSTARLLSVCAAQFVTLAYLASPAFASSEASPPPAAQTRSPQKSGGTKQNATLRSTPESGSKQQSGSTSESGSTQQSGSTIKSDATPNKGSTSQTAAMTTKAMHASLQDFVRANGQLPLDKKQLGDVLTAVSSGSFAGQSNWNVLSNLRSGHPRLIFLKADEDRIKSEVESDPEAKKLLKCFTTGLTEF